MKQLLSCLSFIGFLGFISIIQTRFEDFMKVLHIGGPNGKQKTKIQSKQKIQKTKQTNNKKSMKISFVGSIVLLPIVTLIAVLNSKIIL